MHILDKKAINNVLEEIQVFKTESGPIFFFLIPDIVFYKNKKEKK